MGDEIGEAYKSIGKEAPKKELTAEIMKSIEYLGDAIKKINSAASLLSAFELEMAEIDIRDAYEKLDDAVRILGWENIIER